MTVLEKCRDYCKRISSSDEEYKKLLGDVFINPTVRNKECSRPDTLCEHCELNRFIRKKRI